MITVFTLIKKQIAYEQSCIDEHNAIKKLLTDLDGKAINGRTFGKRFTDKTGFTWCQRNGQNYITGKYDHFMGYTEDPFIRADKFDDYDSAYGDAAQKRIDQLNNLPVLELEACQSELTKHILGILDIFNKLDKNKLDSYNNPVYYPMLKNISDYIPSLKNSQVDLLRELMHCRK